MRSVVSLLLLLLIALVSAQETGAPASLFTSVRPDGYVRVTPHALGGAVVEITMQDAKYPPALLESQVKALSADLGFPANGLTVVTFQMVASDPKSKYVRANFGINGLGDAAKGLFRLQPIARAFAGAPVPNEVKCLDVIFEKAKPSRNTVTRVDNAGVTVELSPVQDNQVVEYRILLKTQDPSSITIPEDAAPVAKPKPIVPPPSKPDYMLWTLVAVAILALGALVYSLLLRGRPAGGARPR